MKPHDFGSALSITLVLTLSLLPRSLLAANFTVNSTADTVDATPGNGVCADGSGNCTLRAAIMEANALAGSDNVSLPAGTYTLTIPGTGENAAATGDLDVIGSLIITGNGADNTIIQACDAGANPACTGIDRVFDVTDSASLILNSLTVRKGGAGGELGGGIRVGILLPWQGGSGTNSSLALNDSKVLNNSSSGGGGIVHIGTVTVNNSVVAGNSGGGGGGISTQIGATLTVTSSTIIGNMAESGGGIFNNPGSLPTSITITNSTISGNTATSAGGGLYQNQYAPWNGPLTITNSTISGNQTIGGGGGIFNAGTQVTLTNVTITDNIADSDGDNIGTGGANGGGLWTQPGGTATIKNSIVAGNFDASVGAGAVVNPDCSGTITSQGYNLIEDPTGCSGLGGSDLTNQDPNLGPLADNGGFTETHTLLLGSPAIDAVPPASCSVTTDQRGVSRPQGADCDMGAVEVSAGPIEVNIDIKPGSFPNSINPRSRGVIPVAILTTDTFDAGTVDPTTVLFGPTGTETVPVHAASEDVDGDGDADMILHFRTQATGIQCGDTSASLTGETFDEQMIHGSDSVNTVGCK